MTIPEASRLILEASLIGEPGDLFVLDMGEPIRIVDLARDLARLAGRDPDSVPIRYIGLRPGEKLHESLFYDAEAVNRRRTQGAAAPGDVGLPAADVLRAGSTGSWRSGATGDHDGGPGRAVRDPGHRRQRAAGAVVADGERLEPIPFHRPSIGAAEREAVAGGPGLRAG